MELPGDPGMVVSAQNEETKTTDQKEFEETDSKFRTPEGNVKTPEVGMTFKNYEEVLDYYRHYAWQVGFDVRVKRTTFTDTGQHYTVEFMCHRGGKGKTDPTYQSKPTAKTDCEATLQLKLEVDGLLHLRRVVLDHNHALDPSLVKWMKRGRRRLSLAIKTEPEGGADSGKKRRKRYRWVPPDKSEEGVECMQSREVSSKTSTSNKGRLMLQEEDIEALYQFFRDMQIKDPNFFYMVDLDRECRLRNVFWADSMSRVSFKAFGDVVLFDTSYLASDYDVPLALFLGVNHHGQLVLLGCALLSDASSETYDWLFKTWLACMEGCSPQALITDQIEALRDPITRIFPGTHHRLCPRQILKRISDNLKKHEKYKEIKGVLIKIVYNSYKCEDFEQEWKAMVEGYGLEENAWINLLYENRHEWVPFFLKNEFWAGISISQQGFSPFFEGCMHPDTSLKQFLSNYETVIGNKYEKMAQADVESSHKGPLLVSKFYMEEQVAEQYTYNIFKEFQEELRGTMYCDMLQIKAPDQSQSQNQVGSVFEIKESVFLEDGADVAEYRVFDVYFEPTEMELSCPCGLFQSKGILCRHSLSVLKLQQIYEIPGRYIIDRWRKDYYFRQLYNSYNFSTNNYSAKNHLERSRSLAERCSRVSNLAMASDERCEVLVRLMAEVERVLLTTGTVGKNVQFKLVQCENRGGESSADMIMTEAADKSLKRRGRPPKKRNDGTVDPMITAKKRPETIGASYIESDMFLAAPTNLEAHVDSQDNMILMGGVDPNVLSLGNQYGMQANRPYTSTDPSRALSNNMIQAQFEQQASGNPARSQWIYHQMLQEGQLPTHHGQGTR
ncbi:protein FAR1-RELATED SEQUENCE 6-like [Carex rostrata]